MSNSIKLSELNEFISCPLCHGYLIDATTVNECLHTFCKSCIVKHIKNNNNDCPKCNTIIHERRPLDYIIQDRSKQDIVYKLVPQLYIIEHNRKKFLQVDLIQKRNVHNRRYSKEDEPAKSEPTAIYLKCPITIQARHIRKLLAVKYQLQANDRINLFYKGDIVSDDDQISNLAQSLTFRLHYEISRICMTTAAEPADEEEEEDEDDNDEEMEK